MLKHSLGFIATVFILGFLLFPQSHFGKLVVVESKQIKTVIPRGKSAPVYLLKVQEDLNSNLPKAINSITLENVAGFGISDVKAVRVHQDINENGSFDEGVDTLVATQIFTSRETIQVIPFSSLVNLTAEKNIVSFILVYEIADTVAPGKIYQAQVRDLNAQGSSFSSTFKSTINISGFKTFIVSNELAPSFAVPSKQDEKIAMLAVRLNISGEDSKQTVVFEIENNQANFVTGNRKDGVVSVRIIQPKVSGDLLNYNKDIYDLSFDEKIKSTDASFVSSSLVRLSVTEKGGIKQDPEETSYLIIYELGENMVVSNDTKVSAQISNISVAGNISELEIDGPSSSDVLGLTGATSKIAGLEVSNLKNSVPSLSDQALFFGPEQVVPILQFSLKSHISSADISAISIQNDQDIQFISQAGDPKDINKIEIFEDADSSGDFSGVDSQDTKVGELVLGLGNQKSLAHVPISKELTDLGVLVSRNISIFDSTKDYPANNEKIFFVVYHLGKQLSQNDGVVESKLANVRGQMQDPLDKIKHIDIELSGNKPLSANPEAQFAAQITPVYLRSATSLTPLSSLIGSTKVPVLKVVLEATQKFDNAQVVIKNSENSFRSSGGGISQVFLFRDTDPANNTFDIENDVQIQGVSSFAKVDEVTFTNVPLFVGQNHFFVLYDVASGALTTEKFTAQLQNVANNPDLDGFLFGGQLPAPTTPTTSAISNNLIEITSVNVTQLTEPLSTIDKNTGEFQVRIKLKKIHAGDVKILDIYPAVYKNQVEKNITDEFSISEKFAENQKTLNVASREFLFNMTHRDFLTEGTARFDAIVLYENPLLTTQKIEIERTIKEDVLQDASKRVQNVFLSGLDSGFPWDYPVYITDIVKKDTTILFGNGGALRQDDGLKITFRDKGRNVDFGSIEVLLNNNPLQSAASSTRIRGAAISTQFVLDIDEGTVLVERLGDTDGTLTIKIKDNLGNSLDDLVLAFSISSEVKLSDLLFFPNPYIIASQNLELGYNLTQDAEVDITIYNFLGNQVFSATQQGKIGYNRYLINSLDSFLQSGTYFCKVVARGLNGEDTATTKLAIY